MSCQTKGTGYHYGLDFVLGHTAEDIQEVIERLAKRNRASKATKITITEKDKQSLRRQLKFRMRIRRHKETRRATRRFK